MCKQWGWVWLKKYRRELVVVAVLILIDIVLVFLPTEFGQKLAESSKNSIMAKVRITAVDTRLSLWG